MMGYLSYSSRNSGSFLARPIRIALHAFHTLVIKPSSLFLELFIFNSLLKIHHTSSFQGRPTSGAQSDILLCRSVFHHSSPGRKLLTTSFAKRARLWSTGSTMPSPPNDFGLIRIPHATLALAASPWLLAHKKLRINLCIWLMHDLEKLQHERMTT